MSNEIILKIRGKSFKGWTSVVVEKSLYQMAGAFGLGATDIYPGDAERWDLAMGDECQVEIDGQVVVTGYVEDIPIDYDASSHNIQIGGRDKTGDLVDCSFIMKKNEWKSRKVIDIIKALCSPYGIEVVVHNSIAQKASQRANQALFPVITKTDEKEDSVKVEEGDTVFEAISKICKVHAILPVSYGDGKLTLTQAGTSQAYDSLELGKNVKLGSLDQSNRDRYQTYICKAQSAGFDWMTTADFVSPKGQITDDVIMRYRPLVILLEKGGRAGQCKDRAKWEMLTRAGNSRSLEYHVQGWIQSNGEVWPLNGLVKVKDSFLQIDETLLVSALSFSLKEDEGTMTRLKLVHPNSFTLLPEGANVIKTGFDWMSKLQGG